MTPGGCRSRDIDAAVRQVIGDAVDAGEVIDLFAAAGLDRASPFPNWGATVTELRRGRARTRRPIRNLTATSKLRDRGTQYPNFNKAMALAWTRHDWTSSARFF